MQAATVATRRLPAADLAPDARAALRIRTALIIPLRAERSAKPERDQVLLRVADLLVFLTKSALLEKVISKGCSMRFGLVRRSSIKMKTALQTSRSASFGARLAIQQTRSVGKKTDYLSVTRQPLHGI